ncbi:MAG: sigma-70 family RNA polymerase sigma factor [Myxococcales bacterium]|nr:sigma-70 family RNA polymerase sigma factor [Myxococcales bacterium]MCB9717734.1 sigma-70 family RNA polymerase sigma factor [Myxococcales bacterium]
MPLDDDLELLRAWRSGQPKAGHTLFRRYYDDVYRFVDSKVPAEDVEELVQETFATLVRKRDEFSGDASFRSYLLGIARLHLLEHYRRRHRDSLNDPLDFSRITAAELGGSMSSVLGRQREHALLRLALPRIPLDHQILLELYLWEEFTAAQLAQIMDIPENTVRSRFRRAKQLLEAQVRQLAEHPEQLTSTLETLSSWIDDVQLAARRRLPSLND